MSRIVATPGRPSGAMPKIWMVVSPFSSSELAWAVPCRVSTLPTPASTHHGMAHGATDAARQ